jgi:hypothetical protein
MGSWALILVGAATGVNLKSQPDGIMLLTNTDTVI